MKHLRQITDKDARNIYGYCYTYGRKHCTIFINLQRIWINAKKKFKTERKRIDFAIETFINTHIHESLHFVIPKYYKSHPKWEYGEEMLVWVLTGEKLNRKRIKYYEKFYKVK